MSSPPPISDETYALLLAALNNTDPSSPEAQGQLRGSFSAAFALLELYKDRAVAATDDEKRQAYRGVCRTAGKFGYLARHWLVTNLVADLGIC